MTPSQKACAQAAIKLKLLTKEQVRGLLPSATGTDGEGLLRAALAAGCLDAEGVARALDLGRRIEDRHRAAAAAAPAAAAVPGAEDADPLEGVSGRAPAALEPPPPASDDDGASAGAPPLPAIAGYEVLARIGSGAMAEVYRARHLALGKEVALKVLAERLRASEQDRARFLREARAAAKVVHPNVIAIYDTGESEGQPFIAMELVEGGNLDGEVRRSGPLAERAALEVGRALARALEAAHARGLVHRDIKPENVLRASDGRLKLCDLGLARGYAQDDSQARITDHGVTLGTPYFLSPEQARGHDLDIRSDLYSLGATLYYLATGQHPFRGRTGPEVMQKHLTEPAPTPSRLRPDLGRGFDELVLRLLEKDPRRRFQTPAACAEAIEALLAGAARAGDAPGAPAPGAAGPRDGIAAPRPRKRARRPRLAPRPVDRVRQLGALVVAAAALFVVLLVLDGALKP